MQSGLAQRLLVLCLNLALCLACQQNPLRGAAGAFKRPDRKINDKEATKTPDDGNDEDGSAIASEPAPIAGAYLIEPGLVTSEKSESTVAMRGSPGSVKPRSAEQQGRPEIELLAFDISSKALQHTVTGYELSVRLVSKTSVTADGSFSLQGKFNAGEWLFLRVPSQGTLPLQIDLTSSNPGLAWLDPLSSTLRAIDTNLAVSLKAQVLSSLAVVENVRLLQATGECRGCDLSGVDFRNQNLVDLDLSGAILTNALFTGAVIERVSFLGADLRYADFRMSNLVCADFENARLDGIILDGASVGTQVSNLILPILP